MSRRILNYSCYSKDTGVRFCLEQLVPTLKPGGPYAVKRRYYVSTINMPLPPGYRDPNHPVMRLRDYNQWRARVNAC